MSEVTLNLSDYKSSGVYFVEIDNSIAKGTNANAALRLAVGFNENGPFNRPVYLSSPAECNELLGDIDRKLERRGCYTNRNIRTMVAKAPVYALNLLSVDTKDSSTNPDVVGFNAISFDASKQNISGKTLFANMYDRTKFWVADSSAMMNAVANANETKAADIIHAPLFAFGNCGTKDISLIVRKAEGLMGYNVTFLDWFGSEDAIPYKWINPYDYVADYFVQVIAVAGNYNNHSSFSADSTWGAFFNTKGLKKEMVNKFLRLDSVNVLGNWTGCIIPEFYNKQGVCVSLDYMVNRVANKTGLMFGINSAALDLLVLNREADENGCAGFYLDYDEDFTGDEAKAAPYTIDLAGINLRATDASSVEFMSYSIDSSVIATSVYTYPATIQNTNAKGKACQFICSDANAKSGTQKLPSVGDFVRAADGTLTKIIKKQVSVVDVSVNTLADASVGTSVDASVDSSVDTSTNITTVKTTIYTYTTNAPIFEYNANDSVNAYSVKDDISIDNDGETIPENEGYQDYMVYGVNEEYTLDPTEARPVTVEIHKQLASLYDTLKFISIPGLKISNRHRPGFDANGAMDIEAGVEKIYKMLEDTGIRKGLLNVETMDFRYIVDTMAGGLGASTAAKKYLAELAMEKGSCTALINLPSMSDFAKSTAPLFCDSYIPGVEQKPAFNVKYIAEGGNQDHAYNESYELFSLPTEEQGAKYAAYFTPYLKYTEGVRTILVPPAADVCNTFMNKYLGGNAYVTIANTNGILSNASISGLEYDFDTTDRAALEPFGINPIISRNGVPMIYGDRTAYQLVNSDFNFLHVRELLNTIEYRCRAILNDYIFTYNNAATRAEIYSRLDPILRSMKDSGALAKYEMQIDEANNTKDIIDQKVCIVDIGVWVTPNMEKIITRLTVNRGSEA